MSAPLPKNLHTVTQQVNVCNTELVVSLGLPAAHQLLTIANVDYVYQALANYCFTPNPACCLFNEGLWGHSHTRSFIYHLRLIFAKMTELSICKRDCMAFRAENIYYLTLSRKSLLISDLYITKD